MTRQGSCAMLAAALKGGCLQGPQVQPLVPGAAAGAEPPLLPDAPTGSARMLLPDMTRDGCLPA